MSKSKETVVVMSPQPLSIEQAVRELCGDLCWSIAVQKTQLDVAQAELKALKDAATVKE